LLRTRRGTDGGQVKPCFEPVTTTTEGSFRLVTERREKVRLSQQLHGDEMRFVTSRPRYARLGTKACVPLTMPKRLTSSSLRQSDKRDEPSSSALSLANVGPPRETAALSMRTFIEPKAASVASLQVPSRVKESGQPAASAGAEREE
jgi:hypothetical protein